jgi:hypothetical protein
MNRCSSVILQTPLDVAQKVCGIGTYVDRAVAFGQLVTVNALVVQLVVVRYAPDALVVMYEGADWHQLGQGLVALKHCQHGLCWFIRYVVAQLLCGWQVFQLEF